MTDLTDLPQRTGPRPTTTGREIPHDQLDQPSPGHIRTELVAHAGALPGVRTGPSQVSEPGSLALRATEHQGPPEAFLMPGIDEFGHIHRSGFMHLIVPAEHIPELIRKGWIEPHPISRRAEFPDHIAMLYAPRDTAELAVAIAVLEASWRQATGLTKASA